MKLAAGRISLTFTSPHDVINAWIGWAALAAASIALLFVGEFRTVTPCYRTGTNHFFDGIDLYGSHGGGFTYLPQAAVLYAPFAALPPIAADVLWRLLIVGVFAFGAFRVERMARQTYPPRFSTVSLFPLLTCVAIPISFDSARNGQSTLLMAGLLMLAVDNIAREKWWGATACICLGVAVKPLAVVFLLLAGALYRPLWWRMPLGMAATFLFPFAFAPPAYVLSQYAAYAELLEYAKAESHQVSFSTLFGALKVAGVLVPEFWQSLARLTTAIATLAACWWITRKHDRQRAAILVFTMSACYLMLMSPRTENNTYSFIAPVIGLFLGEAIFVRKSVWQSAFLATVAVGILGNYEFGKFLTGPRDSVWLAPICCLAFWGYVVTEMRLPRWLDGSSNQLGQCFFRFHWVPPRG